MELGNNFDAMSGSINDFVDLESINNLKEQYSIVFVVLLQAVIVLRFLYKNSRHCFRFLFFTSFTK